jgi:hypothetical protein
MRLFRGVGFWILAGAAVLAQAAAARAQVTVPPWSPSQISNIGMPHHRRHINDPQTRARNAERQKRLVADTQRLLELASELQTDAGKSEKDMLSLEMIRKTEEIQKLAKSVRDKMKDAS